MRVTFVAALLAVLLVVSSVEAGVRFAQQRYAGSRHVRHGSPAVLAEREFEAQGHYGAEQAVVLNDEEREDEPDAQSDFVETYATADRGHRSAAKTERSLSGPSMAMNVADRLTNHFAAPELEPVHEQAAPAAFAVPPVFRDAANLPPPPDSVDISMVDLDAGVYPTPAMLAMRQHAAAQMQAQAPQPAPQPLFQHAALAAPAGPAAMMETAAKFVVPASSSLHNHMHVFQGPPSALAPTAATYAPAAAAPSPYGFQGGAGAAALPRFAGALGAMPFGYPPSPPQFGAVPSGVGASNFQASFPAPPALQLSADPYSDFARMQAYAARQNVVSGAPQMPDLPPPPVGIF